jgi:hypothetical protein
MCKESDNKATHELLEGKINVEEYANRLDSNGACVSATGIISREVRELKNAITELLIPKNPPENLENEKSSTP